MYLIKSRLSPFTSLLCSSEGTCVQISHQTRLVEKIQWEIKHTNDTEILCRHNGRKHPIGFFFHLNNQCSFCELHNRAVFKTPYDMRAVRSNSVHLVGRVDFLLVPSRPVLQINRNQLYLFLQSLFIRIIND